MTVPRCESGPEARRDLGDHTLINGMPGHLIDCADRGLLYGDGLFETIAVRAGRPCLWQAHLARLAASAARLAIPMPDPALWRDEAGCLSVGVTQGTLKLILTRGTGPRGYRAPPVQVPTRILIRSAAPQWPESWSAHRPGDGVVVILCRTRLGTNRALAGIKHLNRLEQVLARAEWDDPAIAEGLMLDQAGRLVCGTMSNLFLVLDGTLLTPRLSGCGVAGTLRAVVIQEARGLGLPVHETDLWPTDLTRADGAFLTNALIGIWPIRRIAAHPLAASARRAQPALAAQSLAVASWSARPLLAAMRARVLGRAFAPGDGW